jgi:hypothetical protein
VQTLAIGYYPRREELDLPTVAPELDDDLSTDTNMRSFGTTSTTAAGTSNSTQGGLATKDWRVIKPDGLIPRQDRAG